MWNIGVIFITSLWDAGDSDWIPKVVQYFVGSPIKFSFAR